jgi:hypothetical protein
MSQFSDRYRQHELESVLESVMHTNYAFIPLKKLLKLLGKGNRAAGTWAALRDAYTDVGGDASSLWIAEFPNEIIFLSDRKCEKLSSWAS